jgi:hypothetical protein
MQQHLQGMFHRAGECDGSGVHEEDLVYLVDGVQAVSDDDLGGFRGEPGKNLFEKLFGDGVDVGGGFVEDQQVGTPQCCAHEGNQLPLAQADATAVAGDFRLQTFREAREQAREIRFL